MPRAASRSRLIDGPGCARDQGVYPETRDRNASDAVAGRAPEVPKGVTLPALEGTPGERWRRAFGDTLSASQRYAERRFGRRRGWWNRCDQVAVTAFPSICLGVSLVFGDAQWNT